MKNHIFFFFVTAAIAGWMITTTPAQAQVAAPDFQALSETLLPTVVNVSTTTKIKNEDGRPALPQMPDLPPGSPFEDFFKDFYDQYQNQDPQREEKVSALGSGFVIDAAGGYIVTNNHVIKDADEIKVIMHDDTSLDATLVGTDEKTDLAVLKVKTDKPLTAAHWGDSDLSKVGSWVLAIGNPFGLGGTVTAGIVSARQRNINAGPYDEFIQTDASINRGNSGGPMFNTKGEVVGVNTAIFSPSGGSVGIGFAVPSNLAKGVVEQLIKYGKTKRGWLGVHIQEVTPEIAESMGLDKPRGALVSGVTPKSPADAAGILAGDIILAFDGKEISQMRHLPRMVAESEVGKKASLTIFRKGDKKEITVDLGQLEKAEEDGVIKTADSSGKEKPSSTEVADVGISLSALNDSLRSSYDISTTTTGVLVTDVKKDGPAADKGLREGDVIVQVDQKDVTAPKEVADLVADAKKAGRSTVLFFVSRKEDMRFIAVKLRK